MSRTSFPPAPTAPRPRRKAVRIAMLVLGVAMAAYTAAARPRSTSARSA